MLDAGLIYIDADLWTDQGWIRRRFVEYRRSFVNFLDENLWQTDAKGIDADLCIIDAESLNLLFPWATTPPHNF